MTYAMLATALTYDDGTYCLSFIIDNYQERGVVMDPSEYEGALYIIPENWVLA